MTRVNLILPLFQTSLHTNNSQIITEIISQKYGLAASNVFWIQPSKEGDKNDTSYECVVRIKDLSLNVDTITELMQKNHSIQQTLKRLKTDIFNVVSKYNQLQNSKKQIQFQKVKEYAANFNEDSEVSLKIQEKSKNNQGRDREREVEYTQSQLINAISQLTRQNLKLKDAVMYYEAQFQFYMKSYEQNKKQMK